MPELLPTAQELEAMPPLKRARAVRRVRELADQMEQMEQQRLARVRTVEAERIRVSPAELEAERH